jgi:hypothetical protein
MSDAKTQTKSAVLAGHEASDPKLAPILRFAAALAILCLAAFFLMRWLFSSETETRRANDTPLPPLADERRVPPEPRLQSLPGVPLVGGDQLPPGAEPFMSSSFPEFEEKQRDALTSYGWIDRQAGVVHIPIDRAIELTLERGLPSSSSKTEKH